MNWSGSRIGLVLFCLMSLHSVQAQVSMRTNLLHTIPLKKSLTFEVRINKGSLSNFARFQVQVPEGVAIREVESKEGTFEFAENKAKIIWVVAPSDSMIAVRMKVGAVQEPLAGQMVFTYYYMEDDDKREYETKPFFIQFKDTVLPVFMSAPMTVLQPVKAPLLPPPDSSKLTAKNPLQVSQQVQQLRKDSKDAEEVGTREKQKAQAKLDSLAQVEKDLALISDEGEKKKSLEQLETARRKAKEDLVIAERVLTLSKTLNSQAGEIERINNKIKNNATASADRSKKSANPVVKPIPPEPKPEKLPASSLPTQGVVYSIQVGAFKQQPGMENFQNLGPVSVIQENSVYKVLVGSYASREDALKQKESLAKRSLDCFIVSYKDGVRLR